MGCNCMKLRVESLGDIATIYVTIKNTGQITATFDVYVLLGSSIGGSGCATWVSAPLVNLQPEQITLSPGQEQTLTFVSPTLSTYFNPGTIYVVAKLFYNGICLDGKYTSFTYAPPNISIASASMVGTLVGTTLYATVSVTVKNNASYTSTVWVGCTLAQTINGSGCNSWVSQPYYDLTPQQVVLQGYQSQTITFTATIQTTSTQWGAVVKVWNMYPQPGAECISGTSVWGQIQTTTPTPTPTPTPAPVTSPGLYVSNPQLTIDVSLTTAGSLYITVSGNVVNNTGQTQTVWVGSTVAPQSNIGGSGCNSYVYGLYFDLPAQQVVVPAYSSVPFTLYTTVFNMTAWEYLYYHTMMYWGAVIKLWNKYPQPGAQCLWGTVYIW